MWKMVASYKRIDARSDIPCGLGKMYVSDERFKKNIDKYGEGTAEFAAETIEKYMKQKN